MDKIPGIRQNPQAQEIQIPGVVLANVNINTQRLPDGSVQLIVGPLMLVLPFQKENAKALAEALQAASSGVIIANDGLLGAL